MGSRLEKRRTVLHKSHEALGHTVYGSRSDEGDVLEVIYIPTETVSDMGSPDELTITIEPGNTISE